VKVIYLHGFASGPTSRKAQFFGARLKEAGIEVVVPDLAQGDFENLTISRQMAVIGRLAGDSPLRLVGSSMGGYLAALWAARYPEQVEKMVLLAPAFGFAERWQAIAGKEGMERWLKTGKLPIFHHAEERERDLGLAMYEDSRQWEGEPEFTAPGLIFHGVKDTVVPVEASRAFAARHPNVRLIELNSDHELLDALPAIWEGCGEFLLE
jgi:hypothetical protein